MISTSKIIDAVEKELNIDVKFSMYDFSKINLSANISNFGAAMSVKKEGEDLKAYIVLNELEIDTKI